MKLKGPEFSTSIPNGVGRYARRFCNYSPAKPGLSGQRTQKFLSTEKNPRPDPPGQRAAQFDKE